MRGLRGLCTVSTAHPSRQGCCCAWTGCVRFLDKLTSGTQLAQVLKLRTHCCACCACGVAHIFMAYPSSRRGQLFQPVQHPPPFNLLSVILIHTLSFCTPWNCAARPVPGGGR